MALQEHLKEGKGQGYVLYPRNSRILPSQRRRKKKAHETPSIRQKQKRKQEWSTVLWFIAKAYGIVLLIAARTILAALTITSFAIAIWTSSIISFKMSDYLSKQDTPGTDPQGGFQSLGVPPPNKPQEQAWREQPKILLSDNKQTRPLKAKIS